MKVYILIVLFSLLCSIIDLYTYAQYRENIKTDALPNHLTEEGKRRLQEWTSSKFIKVESEIEYQVFKAVNIFKESISENDLSKFKSKVKLKNANDEKTDELFLKIISDINKYKVIVNDYSFKISKINALSNNVTVLWLNKDQILTASILLEKNEQGWFIYSIKN